ncbi:hypothetical protein BH20CHL4_BH20CHL4_10620 [soil metagenome]
MRAAAALATLIFMRRGAATQDEYAGRNEEGK